jgi:uncharacterized repeat protein (TIGR03803 family)
MRKATSTLGRILDNWALLLIGLALLLPTAQLASAQITYAIGNNSKGGQYCGTVHLTSGQWTGLNSSLLPDLAGTGEFGGNLYGGTYLGSGLYQVNPANCAYIPVGYNNGNVSYRNFGSTTGPMAALYATDYNYLYLVQPNNGATMLIGPTNLNTTSLSANCQTLYATASEPNGNSALYSVNTNSGATTEIGDTGVSNITAMVCTSGDLYAVRYNGPICTLNLTNGAATCRVSTEPFIVGMAYPPYPPPTFSVLHTFTGGADGGQPWAGMIMDPAGNLYGTTAAGGTGSCSYLGATGCGTILQLKKHNSSYTFNPLYSFQGGTDGEFSARPLTLGPDGTYYGTTIGGGEGTCSFYGVSECGVVFKAGPAPQPPRTPLLQFRENVLYRFSGGSDGGNPFSTVIFDQAGNIYGTTSGGGAHGLGTVFELSHAVGGTYTETVLYSFAGGDDGANPYDGVVFDTAGNLYGTTLYGGGSTVCQFGCGTVFKLSPAAGGNWTEAVLYRFQGANDGQYPTAGIAIDSAGNLYGNTNQPGTGQGGSGGGTVYELSPNGSNWTYKRLYTVPYNGGFGYGRVVLDSNGNLYEALQAGGAFGHGQVFELTHGSWIYTDLYDFTDAADGASPYGGVTVDSSGNLYGTTLIGGGAGCGRGCGVVWEITPPTN